MPNTTNNSGKTPSLLSPTPYTQSQSVENAFKNLVITSQGIKDMDVSELTNWADELESEIKAKDATKENKELTFMPTSQGWGALAPTGKESGSAAKQVVKMVREIPQTISSFLESTAQAINMAEHPNQSIANAYQDLVVKATKGEKGLKELKRQRQNIQEGKEEVAKAIFGFTTARRNWFEKESIFKDEPGFEDSFWFKHLPGGILQTFGWGLLNTAMGGTGFGVFIMRPVARGSVNKSRSVRQFRKNSARTKRANVSTSHMRGGIRL